MRVLFTLFPATAHLHTMVPLAHALQGAGHEVVVACQEGALDPEIVHNITEAGLTAVPLGPAADGPPPEAMQQGLMAFADAWRFDPAHPGEAADWHAARALLGGMFSFAYPDTGEDGSFLDELIAFTRSWRPDLILWDKLMIPAAIAARVTDTPHARLVWGLDSIAALHELTEAETPGRHTWLNWLDPHLARHGLDLTDDILLGRWTLDLVPPSMRPPLRLPAIPVRRLPFNGSSPLPDWLHGAPERPRVVLTFGVSRRMIGGHSTFPAPEFLERVAELDVEVVATLGRGGSAGEGTLPANVRTVDYIPLNQVLPTTSAIVHQGGTGTFTAAVAHQVPQLVVPVVAWDEPQTARYVEKTGAGLVADTDALDPDTLFKQLTRLLDEPSFKEGARRLYEETLAAPAPRDVVPVLERLVAAHRPGGRA
ncbi:nucleotide disphospho-sugar-binding domain-containing protein [Streptomyces sp. NPDC004539]|uniref:nucleotide disphospho-sugar-binding domain-containing protein n=1 Tax=Streptomyces sp. NPDC004539 TaxID=3154280 RepID=UPI0033BE9B47